MTDPLLRVEDLTIQYETSSGPVTAASGVSFDLRPGEFLGLAGESGAGKSTVAKSIIGGLESNGSVVDGRIIFDGRELQSLSEQEFNEVIRWKEIAWIPQGSMNSLDPLRTIGAQAIEIADVHTDLTDEEALDRFKEAFEIVGLQPNRVTEYPHQFSGGMQQRAIIALALFLEPSLIIADEPTTALDVIMQDQIFKYLNQIKPTGNTSMLLITHDISLIFESCEQIVLMHAGQVAERGNVIEVNNNPRHPYTRLLKRAFPDIRYPERDLAVIKGHPPRNFGEVTQCTFVDRCPWGIDACRDGEPELLPASNGDADHVVGCIRAEELDEVAIEEGIGQ